MSGLPIFPGYGNNSGYPLPQQQPPMMFPMMNNMMMMMPQQHQNQQQFYGAGGGLLGAPRNNDGGILPTGILGPGGPPQGGGGLLGMPSSSSSFGGGMPPSLLQFDSILGDPSFMQQHHHQHSSSSGILGPAGGSASILGQPSNSNNNNASNATIRKTPDETLPALVEPSRAPRGALPTTVLFTGLSWWTSDEDLKAMCIGVGVVPKRDAIRIYADPISGRSKGMAIVGCDTQEQASAIAVEIPKRSNNPNLVGTVYCMRVPWESPLLSFFAPLVPGETVAQRRAAIAVAGYGGRMAPIRGGGLALPNTASTDDLVRAELYALRRRLREEGNNSNSNNAGSTAATGAAAAPQQQQQEETS